jgi:hypothetical protein
MMLKILILMAIIPTFIGDSVPLLLRVYKTWVHSCSGDRLPEEISWGFSVYPYKFQEILQTGTQPRPFACLTFHHWLIILPFDTVRPELLIALSKK